jgi:adenine-specific DNA-methyltransferase
MSDEESGREEKFFHETLDRADIDTLRDPKVLTNFEKIDKDGIRTISNPDEIEFWDEDGELRENLLIKGNNLIALYSLRQKLAGKIKLIYIDPPYNTGDDSFKYNDKFIHSSWLVFMRNRLEMARELLRDDGVIFVQCDDNEQAYLRVLMDEIYWRDNFTWTFIWEKKKKPSFLSKMWNISEYIISFAKNKANSPDYIHWETTVWKKYPINNAGNWVKTLTFPAWSVLFRNSTTIYEPQDMSWGNIITKLLDRVIVENWRNINEFRLEWEWRYSQEKINSIIKEWEQIIISQNPFRPNHVKSGWDLKKAKNLLTIAHYDMSTYEDSNKEMEVLFQETKFDYPKPEKLISFLIWAVTDENDIVLDYHLWSWTTSAVAHKMGRRWIGIEQMDYIEDIAKVRLQKVIEWEQGGISKSVEWQWGGNFVYMELKAYNIEFVERIESARTKEELHAVYVEMASNAFLQFWFDRRDFERDGYKTLPLEEQKVKLRELLDLNQLYLNVWDMHDSRHQVSSLEQSLTDQFYGKE